MCLNACHTSEGTAAFESHNGNQADVAPRRDGYQGGRSSGTVNPS